MLNFDKAIFVVFPFGSGNDKDEQNYVKTSRVVNKGGRKITKNVQYSKNTCSFYFTFLKKTLEGFDVFEITLPCMSSGSVILLREEILSHYFAIEITVI